MATIGERLGLEASHLMNQFSRHNERPPAPTGEPHAFWGDPPSLAVCEEWLQRVRARLESVEAQLSLARAGGRITDDDGRPLRHEEYEAWRSEQIHKKNKLVRRLRILKAWRAERHAAEVDAGDVTAKYLRQDLDMPVEDRKSVV